MNEGRSELTCANRTYPGSDALLVGERPAAHAAGAVEGTERPCLVQRHLRGVAEQTQRAFRVLEPEGRDRLPLAVSDLDLVLLDRQEFLRVQVAGAVHRSLNLEDPAVLGVVHSLQVGSRGSLRDLPATGQVQVVD